MTYMSGAADSVPDLEQDDRKAIADVIRAETLAFQDEDFEAWKACWVHDERTQDVYVSPTAGLSVLDGWRAAAEHMEEVFQSGVSCKMRDFSQDDLRIDIAGNMAWVVFSSWSTTGYGTELEAFETRILERDGRRWKILYSSFVEALQEGPDDTLVGVDGQGRVLRASATALGALKRHPILTVSAGRLRAQRPVWDKALQQAFAQAARHHGHFATHKVAHEMGGPAQYPVILGSTDEGGVAVAHLSIRDCVTYVQIGGDDHLDRRLKFAQKVFGLSEGQLRVARKIALGAGLKVLAADLGISVNTARTHLSRLYEKTGVRSQPALVRLLLSVG